MGNVPFRRLEGHFEDQKFDQTFDQTLTIILAAEAEGRTENTLCFSRMCQHQELLWNSDWKTTGFCLIACLLCLMIAF